MESPPLLNVCGGRPSARTLERFRDLGCLADGSLEAGDVSVTTDQILTAVAEHIVRPTTGPLRNLPRLVGGVPLSRVVRAAETVFVAAVSDEGLSQEAIAADFEAAGLGNAAGLAANFHDLLVPRRGEMQRALKRKTLQISAGTLDDFDWSLRVSVIPVERFFLLFLIFF